MMKKYMLIILLNCLISLFLIITGCLVAKAAINENTQSWLERYVRSYRIPCKDLSMHPQDDRETFSPNRWRPLIDKKGEYVCKTESVDDIVKTVTDKWSRRRVVLDGEHSLQYLACGDLSLARKTGSMTVFSNRILNEQHFTEKTLQVKVNWDLTTKHSFDAPDILYDDGEITIPDTRWYFVYASVMFNVNNSKAKQHRLAIRICKRKFNYESTILSDTKLFMGNNRYDVTAESLHVENLIFLSKADHVFVRVSGSTGLIPDSTGNSFGIFPV